MILDKLTQFTILNLLSRLTWCVETPVLVTAQMLYLQAFISVLSDVYICQEMPHLLKDQQNIKL